MRIAALTILLPVLANAASAGAEEPLYKLDLSGGSLPAGVKVENVNGVLPDEGAYKHGYTKQGWIVDRLDNRGYVALSPTYNGANSSCENVLSFTLPSASGGKELLLEWDARSVYRHFPESYRVELQGEGGESAVLAQIKEEAFSWQTHRVALSASGLSGDVTVRFVCTSSNGYMLALTGVQVVEAEARAELTDDESYVEEELFDFTRKLVVDHGTGTWCTNCPVAEIDLDALRNEYPERLIELNTHVNDIMANKPYWDALKWYSVPRMMLNRIKATEGDGTKKFKDYYDQPSQFSVKVKYAEDEPGHGIYRITGKVQVAETIDNSDDRYRMAYVVTADFHKPENPLYAQKNNCTQPVYGAYYYLPSLIPAPLMYYDDVTATYETAFTGVEGSLPATLEPGVTYDFRVDMDRPELVMNSSGISYGVLFVLDTKTGEILNADRKEAYILMDVKGISAESDAPAITCRAEGGQLKVEGLTSGANYRVEAFRADGGLVASTEGTVAGSVSLSCGDAEGLLIVRATADGAVRVAKVMMR